MYEEPKITRKKSSKATEGGCCLQSCGGSPKAIQEKDLVKDDFQETKKKIKKVAGN